MNTVTIYGSSDDLIEVEGDISEEFGHDNGFLFFDDGTIVQVEYNNGGVWRINIIEGPAKIKSHQQPCGPEEYSEKMTLEGEFKTVDCFRNNPPDRDDFSERLDDFTPSDFSCDQLRRIYAITKE